MLLLLLRLRNRVRRREGAIALLTLCFTLTAGVACIMTLWAISWSSGAFNTLYNATQASAYAAVGQTQPPTPGGSSATSQLTFKCTADDSGWCPVSQGGDNTAALTAQKVLASLLPACGNGIEDAQCHFGMVYTTDNLNGVKMARKDFLPENGIYTYTITVPPATARAFAPNPNLTNNAADDSDCIQSSFGGSPQRFCWTVFGDKVVFPAQYASGVAVYTTAVTTMPMCNLNYKIDGSGGSSVLQKICQVSISSSAGATVSQPAATSY